MKRLLLFLTLLSGILLFLPPARSQDAQEKAGSSAPPVEILKQLFPDKTFPPSEITKYRSTTIDFNGDGRKEWIVIYNPNEQPKTSTRKGCLCPKPKRAEKANEVAEVLSEIEKGLYKIEVAQVSKKVQDIHVWFQQSARPDDPFQKQVYGLVMALAKKARAWKKWGLRRLHFVEIDSGETLTIAFAQAQKLLRLPAKRRDASFERWITKAEATTIPTCPCPKVEPKAATYKPLDIVVAAEVVEPPKPAEPPGERKETGMPDVRTELPSETPAAPTYPKLKTIGRFQGDNLQPRPLTRSGQIIGLSIEQTTQLERSLPRITTETIYFYDEGNVGEMKRVLEIETTKENDLNDPGARLWSQVTTQNLDADEWLEIVVERYYESMQLNGPLSRQVYKWHENAYVPFDQARGILRVVASSTWENVAPKGSALEQKHLLARTSPSNVTDGFRETAWVPSRSPRGIGDWVRIEFVSPQRLLGVAIAAQIPTLYAPIVPQFFPDDPKDGPPRLKEPSYLVLKMGNQRKENILLSAGERYQIVQFSSPQTARYLEAQITSEYTDPSGKRSQLRIEPKERSLGFLSEIVPLFDKIRYAASSYEAKTADRFPPEDAGDNKPTTAWAEGRSDDGIGEWLQMIFPMPREVSQITVVNGCERPGESYILNHRIKDARLTFSNGSTQDITLKDGHTPEVIKFPTKRTLSILLTIRSIYKGKLGSTTCLAEFRP